MKISGITNGLVGEGIIGDKGKLYWDKTVCYQWYNRKLMKL